MSQASEYAAQINAIRLGQANAIAEGKRTTGAILGNTIATLGSVIPQQVQDVMKRNAEKRKTAQIQGIFQKHGDDLPSAIGEVMQIDPTLGMELGERYQKAAKSAFEYQQAQWDAKAKRLAFVNNHIGSATDQDSYTDALTALKLAGEDISQFPREFSPAVVAQANRSLLTAQQRLEMDKPKAPEPFTLSPGQTRFDATGKPIANLEKTPEETSFTLSPGQKRFDATGAEIAGVPGNVADGGFTLAPGARRYDAQGHVIATAPDRPQRPTAGAGGAGTSTIPPTYRLALERATLNLPNVRRGNITNAAQHAYETGGEKALADVIREAAIETEPVAARDRIMGRMSTIEALTDAKAIMEEMQRKGVPTNILRGTAEDVARKLGTSTNTEYVRLATLLNTVMINYRRSITGAAFGQQEGADYEKLFPNYKNTLPVNTALIEGLKGQMASYDRSYWTHKVGPDGAALIGVIPATSAAAPPASGGANSALAELERRRKALGQK